MKIYIATWLRRAKDHNTVRDIMLKAGHELTYDWTLTGDVSDREFKEISKIAVSEVDAVRNAEAVLVLLPGGNGTHGELVGALTTNKKVFLHAPDGLYDENNKTNVFYHHPNVKALVGGTLEDFSKFVLDILDEEATMKTLLSNLS